MKQNSWFATKHVRIIAGSIVAVVALAAIVIAIILSGDNEEARGGQLSPAELVELKNRGVAHLENHEFAESVEVLEPIAEQLPDELIGHRNLVISQIVPLRDRAPGFESEAERAEAEAKAKRHLAKLESIDDPMIVSLLEARLAQAMERTAESVEIISRAVEEHPNEPVLWYELHLLRVEAEAKAEGVSRSRDVDPEIVDPLKRAFALRPDNLHLLLKYWLIQVQTEDPSVAETIQRASELFVPFVESVRQQSRLDLPSELESISTAIEEGNWRGAEGRVRRVINVFSPEVARQLDERRVHPHELEFVVVDYSDDYQQKLSDIESDAPPAIPVEFARMSNLIWPQIDGLRDFELVDFDIDGRRDLIALREGELIVFRRTEDNWSRLTALDLDRSYDRLICVDLDRDHRATPPDADKSRACLIADADVIVYGDDGVAVFENRYNGGDPARSLIPAVDAFPTESVRNARAAIATDFDHDGDLDLLISTDSGLSAWLNRENFSFVDVSSRFGELPEGMIPTSLHAVDWNRNVAIDFIVGDAHSGRVGWLENMFHSRFRWQADPKLFEELRGVRDIAVAEIDGNASWDLIAVGERGIQVLLTESPSHGVIRPKSIETISEEPFTHVRLLDYDNDGFHDLLVWNTNGESRRLELFRGEPDGDFQWQSETITDIAEPVREVECIDLDQDGDIDLVVTTANGALVAYENQGGNAYGWYDVALSADLEAQMPSERTNIMGVGSLLELKTGHRYQAQTAGNRTTHFGLGQHKRPDVLRVLWTNGIPQNVVKPEVNRPICAKQELKGSCPYLYTWTEGEFAFHTDCLWAAPIGLQFAEGVLAPARAWEYLKISGDRLSRVNGRYRLQITEELWEAAYFDTVQLMAVDHPEDVEVFSNEKIGPPEIAEFRIHTVRHRRIPRSIYDSRGRDVRALLAVEDDRYFKPFTARWKQGLVDEHFVEFDLGELDRPKRITLFLRGWVFPTDTSLNVALSQNPSLSGPAPPSVWVPDECGAWKLTRQSVGFPGGKTKTIAIDLSDAFLTDDYRVRVVSSMELYWDAAFFTVDEEPAKTEMTHLPLVSAELSYRGFSRVKRGEHHGPESFHYDEVETAPKWPPMLGRFTRYGDVTELVRTQDDQSIVLGAGDAMTLEFRALDPPPPGWTRDFLLYNVGWDKDADLNTVFGQSVEPYPFDTDQIYPYSPETDWDESAAHRDYLSRYQQRSQNPLKFWRQILRWETR